MSRIKSIFKNAKFTGDGNLSKWGSFFLTFPVLPATLSNVLIHNAFIKYYVDVIGLKTELMATIWLVFGIWNAINDPVIGVLIDRKKYDERKGKLLYLMKITVPLMAFASFAMVFAQPSWDQMIKFAFLLIMLFIYDTAYTTFNISFASFRFLAAPSSKDRVDISVFNVWLSNIGGLFGTIVPTLLLVGNSNNTLTVIVFAAVTALSAIFYFLALKPLKETKKMYSYENKSIDERDHLIRDVYDNVKAALKSKAFRTYVLFEVLTFGATSSYFTVFLFLSDHVWKLSGTGATLVDIIPGVLLLLASPIIGKHVKKVGARKATLRGIVPTAFSFLALFIVNNVVVALIVYSCVRIFTNFMAVSGIPMIGAIIDEDQIRTGQRRAGLYNGINALITIPAVSLQTSLFLFIIGMFGFVEGAATQTDSAMMGIRIAGSVVPFVFILLGMIPMLSNPITHKRELEISAITKARLNEEELSTNK